MSTRKSSFERIVNALFGSPAHGRKEMSRHRRLGFESLESRKLLSVSPLLPSTFLLLPSQSALIADDVSTQSSSSPPSYYLYYATLGNAHTNENTNPYSVQTVLVDTSYVFQTDDVAYVGTEIWGYIDSYGYEWSIVILDPGNYWGSNTTIVNNEFWYPDSRYIENTFTWHKPERFENDAPEIDRDFTFRFSVGSSSSEYDYVDLDVHIAWAEFSLFVDAPNPGHFDIIVANDIGHTFWEIDVDPFVKTKLTSAAQAYVDQPFGYYPNGFDNKSLIQAYFTGTASSFSVPGKLHNDTGHSWDVKKTYTIISLYSLQSIGRVHELFSE